MNKYIEFYQQDNSQIAIEYWSNHLAVEMHKHSYYELFFIEKGSCTHFYNQQKTLLIPGDCFLVSPHQEHGFDVHNHSSIYNCQFYATNLTKNIKIISEQLGFHCQQINLKNEPDTFQANINKKGIIHLAPEERTFILSIVNRILDEQNKQQNYFQALKQNYLETVLIIIKRVLDQQYKNFTVQPRRKQAMISNVLSFIENNLTEDINFVELAKVNNVSPNHFRKLFKDFTGLSPVDYINRLRIVKACDSLLNGNTNMSDVAASVGIYDSNYFSRLFKQYMGSSPRDYSAQNRNVSIQQSKLDSNNLFCR